MIIALIVLLSVCIALMLISLLSDQVTFGKISGYVAIGGVIVTLVGLVIIVRMNSRTRMRMSTRSTISIGAAVV